MGRLANQLLATAETQVYILRGSTNDRNTSFVGIANLLFLNAGVPKLHFFEGIELIVVRTGGEGTKVCFDTRLQFYNLIVRCCNLIG